MLWASLRVGRSERRLEVEEERPNEVCRSQIKTGGSHEYENPRNPRQVAPMPVADSGRRCRFGPNPYASPSSGPDLRIIGGRVLAQQYRHYDGAVSAGRQPHSHRRRQDVQLDRDAALLPRQRCNQAGSQFQCQLGGVDACRRLERPVRTNRRWRN